MRQFYVLVFAFIVGSFELSHAASSDLQSLNEVVQQAIRQHESVSNTGLSVAVIKDGKMIFAQGYGYRDRANRLPVTAETHFLIGSATKAFTAVAAKIAEERGLLKLDKPVKDVLPEFALSSSEASSKANLIDLLSHRTGVPRHDALWYLSGLDRDVIVAQLGCLAGYKNGHPKFRSGFAYSNLMYTAAGIAIERVSGEKYEAFVQKNIFDSVGMKQTGFFAPDFDRNFAQSYHEGSRLPYKDHTVIAPAGAIVSNAKDLGLWVQTHLSGGITPAGSTLLTRSSIESMYAPHNEVSANQKYGLGWFVEQVQGLMLVHHGGSSDGYHSFVSFIPAKGVGVVVLANEHLTRLPEKVAYQIYEHILDIDMPEVALPAAKKSKIELPRIPWLFGSESGVSQKHGNGREIQHARFKNCSYGPMTFTSEGNSRYLNYGENKWRLWKIPFYGYLFSIYAYGKQSWIPFKYSSDARGFSLPFEQASDEIVFHSQAAN